MNYTSDHGPCTFKITVTVQEHYNTLHTYFNTIITHEQNQKQALTPDIYYIQKLWSRADIDHSGTLNELEINKLLPSLNINMPRSVCHTYFTQFDTDNNKVLTYNEFTLFLQKLTRRVELEKLWYEYIKTYTSYKAIDKDKHKSSSVSEEEALKLTITVEELCQWW